jgi:hypothetical protein
VVESLSCDGVVLVKVDFGNVVLEVVLNLIRFWCW